MPSPSPAALHFTATARRRGKTAIMTAEEGSINVIGLPRCCTGAAALDKGRVAVGSLGGGACSVDLGPGQTLSSWRGDDAPQNTVLCASNNQITVALSLIHISEPTRLMSSC